MVAVYLACGGLGGLLGGVVGDAAARVFPDHGRIAVTQFSVAVGIPFALLLLKVCVVGGGAALWVPGPGTRACDRATACPRARAPLPRPPSPGPANGWRAAHGGCLRRHHGRVCPVDGLARAGVQQPSVCRGGWGARGGGGLERPPAEPGRYADRACLARCCACRLCRPTSATWCTRLTAALKVRALARLSARNGQQHTRTPTRAPCPPHNPLPGAIAACSAPFVGVLAQQWYGFSGTSKVTGDRATDLANARALGNALLAFLTGEREPHSPGGVCGHTTRALAAAPRPASTATRAARRLDGYIVTI